jgi:heme-binding protein
MRVRTPGRKLLLRAGLGVVLVAVLLQFLPFGRLGPNPPVTRDAPWPDGRARELAVAACYDCHSNQTRRPLYSRLAPISWLIARDVEQGREKLNFSTWEGSGGDARDAAETIVEGSMPPRRYLPLHADARLSEDERRLLVEALEAMGGGGDRGGPGGG